MSRGVRAVLALALFALAWLCGLPVPRSAAERTYWNDVTHTSTWEEPDVPGVRGPRVGQAVLLRREDRREHVGVPGAWKEVASDEHGQPYYHNADGREHAGEAEVLGETDESGREKELR